MAEKANSSTGFLKEGFNKKKLLSLMQKHDQTDFSFLQKVSQVSCFGEKEWPQINLIDAWILTSETATFMKWGGLGMVASELPENFNKTFEHLSHKMSIVTPMYEGDTGKKSAHLLDNISVGAENRQIAVELVGSTLVRFADGEGNLKEYSVEV